MYLYFRESTVLTLYEVVGQMRLCSSLRVLKRQFPDVANVRDEVWRSGMCPSGVTPAEGPSMRGIRGNHIFKSLRML
jgi:hypothetical protein